MAFTFDAGIAGRKRDEDEERPQGSVRDDTRVYNEGGRKVGDLPTVTPRDEDEQPMVYDPGVNKPAAEEKEQYADLHPEQYEYSWTEEQRKYYDDQSKKNNEALGLTETKTETPKKQEEKPLVYVPQNTNAGTSGAGTNAAGTKAALTGMPEGAESWTPEQWREYMNQPGNREAMAEVTRQGTDRTAAANRQERRERGGADRAERNAPQGTFQPRTNQGSTSAPASDQPAYAWQGIRPGDYAALMDLMTGGAPRIPETSGTPRIPDTGGQSTPAPQREPDSVRFAREAAERRNAAAGSIAAANANREAVDAYAAQERARRERADQLRAQEEYAEGWRRRNNAIQNRLMLQNYEGPDPLQREILKLNAGVRDRSYETHGYDPAAIRLAEARRNANNQEWLAENGLSWSGQPMSENEKALAGSTVAAIEARNNGLMPDAPKSTLPDPQVIDLNKKPKEGPTRPDVTQEQLNNAIDVLNRQGIYGDEATRQAYQMLLGINGMKSDINAWLNPEQSDATSLERKNQFLADEAAGKYNVVIPDDSVQIPGTNTYMQEPRRAGEKRADEQSYSYNGTPTTGGREPRRREESSPVTNPNRPGANAEVNSWSGDTGTTTREPDSVQYAREAAERRNAGTQSGAGSSGSGGTTGAGTGTGTGSGTGGTGSGSGSGSSGNGKNKDVPEGSKYYPPSYNQEGKVVKAPYRKGGYTEEEIIKMGNDVAKDKYGKPLKDRYGNPFYEGYYKAPDGHYYPVDQIKANYFLENGSYAGWNEGMRDYWNTFGTFYGYRPGWKVDGRLGSGGGGGGGYSGGGRSGGGYSYGGGSSSSGRGGGATANNGLYWNGNTSWNI